jgi:hypothetical protein
MRVVTLRASCPILQVHGIISRVALASVLGDDGDDEDDADTWHLGLLANGCLFDSRSPTTEIWLDAKVVDLKLSLPYSHPRYLVQLETGEILIRDTPF